MTIWKTDFDLHDLARCTADCSLSHLGIEFTAFGPDWLAAQMPVDARTKQPFGLLHGGASVFLAESLGSVASQLCIDPLLQNCVSLDINANHLRSVREGFVRGVARPLLIGQTTHAWEIRISDDQDRLVCVSRMTIAIFSK